MANVFLASAAAHELADAVQLEATRFLFGQFAARWSAEQAAPSASTEAIARAREEFALPIFVGAMKALAEFVWETAPPDGTVLDLLTTMDGNATLAAACAADARPSGGFWLHVATEMAKR